MTDTNTNTANLPSSFEPAVYGDSGGIEGGSVKEETHQKKTGVFTVTDTVVAYVLPSMEFIQMKEGMIYQRLMNVLTPALSDGRQYAVQIQPLQKQPKHDKNVLVAGEWTLTATVLLVHASDAQIGECCIHSDEFDYRGEKEAWIFGETRKHEFEILEDGSGWRRIA
jgi:hypothetical protein